MAEARYDKAVGASTKDHPSTATSRLSAVQRDCPRLQSRISWKTSLGGSARAFRSATIKVFEGKDIRVILGGGWSNAGPCVVTFDCFQLEPSPSRAGFGQTFFEDRKVDAIHVLPRENDWYQSAELDAALEAVAAITAGRVGGVCTYGASMGGYAALRFARRVHAQTAVALAPQFSIDLSVTPFDRRWRESGILRFRPERNGKFELPQHPIVIYDPSVPEDARHVELIARQGRIERAAILYAGHSVGLMLSQVHLLGEFVVDLLDGRQSVSELVRTARSRRRRSAQYWSTLARRARERRRVDLACMLAARAVDLSPHYAEYRQDFAQYQELRRASAGLEIG